MINVAIGKVVVHESINNDCRVGIIYYMLNGLKTIKCFALENYFLKRIVALRETQVAYQKAQTTLAAVGWAILSCSGYMITMIILIVYWKLNFYLDVSFSFSTLTILAYLSSAVLSLSLGGMTGVQQFLYICRRIATIFDLPDMQITRLPRNY